jgi:hypothetical protein
LSEPSRFDWEIVDVGDNGEFISWATVIYKVDGVEINRETFHGTSEEPPGHSGYELALSDARAWWETREYTIEERLGPFGLEWQREQEERHGRAS